MNRKCSTHVVSSPECGFIVRGNTFSLVSSSFYSVDTSVSGEEPSWLSGRSTSPLPCFQIQIFCSFPLLEDLTLISRGRGDYGSGVKLYFSTEHGSFESVPVIFVFDVVANAHNMLPDVRWTPTRRGFGRGLFRLYRYHGGGRQKVSRR